MEMNLRSPDFLVGLVSLEIIAAIFLNAFITINILRDFLKKKSMKSGGKIRVALNISSILFTIVTSTNVFITCSDSCEILYLNDIFASLTIYSMCSGTWLTALHCFFKFTKIVEFKSNFMTWVKMKIAIIVDYSIGVISVMSLGNSLLSILLFTFHQVLSTNSSFTSHDSSAFGTRTTSTITVTFILALNSMPFLAVIITILLTVRFLWVHSHKMEKNMRISGEVNQKTYKRTMIKLMWFLVFYTVFYCTMLSFYLSLFALDSPGYWITLIMMFSFTPTQAIILILETPKLKNNLKAILYYISCSKK